MALEPRNWFELVFSVSDETLESARFAGDSIADQLANEVLGVWKTNPSQQQIEHAILAAQKTLETFKKITTNAELIGFLAEQESLHGSQSTMVRFLRSSTALPDWVDLEKIKRTEVLFEDSGVLTCVLLFFSSLPEVYMASDISAVLHTTGNLEKQTEQRIRTTATMTLSSLLRGGLYEPDGAGLIQILRARLIHALVRKFLYGKIPVDPGVIVYAAATPANAPRNMFEAMVAHDWDSAKFGTPCNQEEMVYTLLTFGYVYLRSLRRLSAAYSGADEEAYLHTWNVIGYFLGINPELMPTTMQEAELLFEQIQNRSETQGVEFDRRPLLGRALLATLEKSVFAEQVKPMVALLMRYLTSSKTIKGLGVDGRFGIVSKFAFTSSLKAMFLLEKIIRRFRYPTFSMNRVFIRIIGYRLLLKVLTDPKKPLELPAQLRIQIKQILHVWSYDPLAPKWLNSIESRFTARGSWTNNIFS